LSFAKILIGSHCKKSISDYLNAIQDKDGTILKKRITDKQTGVSYEPVGHILDTKKDFIVQAFNDEYLKFQNRNKKIIPGQIIIYSRTPKYTM